MPEDAQVEAGVGEDDFASSFWPWDSVDKIRVKELWARVNKVIHVNEKLLVNSGDNDVTRKLLKTCRVTGCYLQAFPSRDGIKDSKE